MTNLQIDMGQVTDRVIQGILIVQVSSNYQNLTLVETWDNPY